MRPSISTEEIVRRIESAVDRPDEPLDECGLDDRDDVARFRAFIEELVHEAAAEAPDPKLPDG